MWSVFVNNRCKGILLYSKSVVWRFVLGTLNPADVTGKAEINGGSAKSGLVNRMNCRLVILTFHPS